MTISEIITLIVALGGWGLAAFIAWLNYRQKSDEIFYHALDWLSGKSQRRNLGIAAIEAYWENNRFRDMSISLLINSAIYLILESHQEDAEHELNNLSRMMNLVLNVKQVSKRHRFHYNSLYDALKKAKSREKQEKGLVIPGEKLDEWSRRLETLL
ncbi:Uncharacterised protein [uncultured archaeon]|nr:Uncharacterised protein [uncultured archaeon]